MSQRIIVILVMSVFPAPFLLAQDLKLTSSNSLTPVISSATQNTNSMDIVLRNGEVYKNCTVTRVAPDGITITHKTGITKLPFPSLPAEFQEKYNYDPEKAELYAKNVELQRAAQFKIDQQAIARRKAKRQAEEDAYERDKAAGKQAAASAAEENQALQLLAQNVRNRTATTAQCRALVGCTKEQVKTIMGAPDSAGVSSFSYNGIMEMESYRRVNLLVTFRKEIVVSVYW